MYLIILILKREKGMQRAGLCTMADRLLQQTQLRSRLCPEVEETNRVIGRGAYGVVVEMKLPDGTVVAGKKINNSFIESSGDLNNDRTMKEKFEQECMR